MAPWRDGKPWVVYTRNMSLIMPAKSKAQQMAAGAALSAKRGDKNVRELRGASKSMYGSMTEAQLEELASAKRKGKPAHQSKR
jgi:Protein of unknwon function (DUF3008)